jgi:hypothetical protein
MDPDPDPLGTKACGSCGSGSGFGSGTLDKILDRYDPNNCSKNAINLTTGL